MEKRKEHEIESREDTVYRTVGTWVKQAKGQLELEQGDKDARKRNRQ